MAFARLPLLLPFSLAALAPLVAAGSACGIVTATVVTGGPDGGVVDAALDADDAHTFPFGDALPEADAPTSFCAGTNTLITLPDGRCTGDVGKKTFLFAACACTTMQVAGALTTDALNSATGSANGDGASVGADTWIRAQSASFIQGSIWSGATALSPSTPAIRLEGNGVVTRELHAGADLTTLKPFTIQGDVFVTGDIFAVPSLTCGGVVHISPGGNTSNVNASKIDNNTELVVDDPCDCSNPLSIAPIVAAFETTNDDALIGLDRTSLVDAPATPIALPCGQYYFDSIGGNDVSLALSGRTAIFVAGNVDAASLHISLAAGAELDLFIAGDLSLNGDATLGTTDAPAHARVYVGGTSATISGAVKVGANVYAPNADMAIASDFEMSGALLVHSLAVSGKLTIHYDVSILNLEGCQSTAKTCATCHDCSGGTPSCTKAGLCVPCQKSADCCAPLACDVASGQCIADLK